MPRSENLVMVVVQLRSRSWADDHGSTVSGNGWRKSLAAFA
ncbi:MAG: hypothetical protein JWN96_2193 [Mycobacterium sp.]|nr:hypothetical protein [Mycobacterium sp.]